MAEVYMYIYIWQEKMEENQESEDFCHAPVRGRLAAALVFMLAMILRMASFTGSLSGS
jgi:hypothetical protein